MDADKKNGVRLQQFLVLSAAIRVIRRSTCFGCGQRPRQVFASKKKTSDDRILLRDSVAQFNVTLSLRLRRAGGNSCSPKRPVWISICHSRCRVPVTVVACGTTRPGSINGFPSENGLHGYPTRLLRGTGRASQRVAE